MSSMRKVDVSIDIEAKPSAIISAFTDAHQLKDWWQAERVLIEPRTGGLYTLAWTVTPAGFGFVSTGLITAYRPDSILQIDKLVYMNPQRPFLGPMTLTVTAEEKEHHSILRLCQDGYGEGPDWDWYYQAVKGAWPQVLQTLKAYLENRKHI